MLTFKEFKNKTWLKEMNESKGLDGFDNYSGAADQEWCNYVVLLGRSRDSEILEESNFECALEQLGGESKNVHVERFGHWGCGWFELILVNPKHKAIKKAYEIYKGLQNYPIVDEDDFGEKEYEYQSNYANQSKKDLAKAISKHFKIKFSSKLVQLAFDLQMECQAYAGNDSCINIYEQRKPDPSDVERLKRVMRSLEYQYEDSKPFKQLMERIK